MYKEAREESRRRHEAEKGARRQWRASLKMMKSYRAKRRRSIEPQQLFNQELNYHDQCAVVRPPVSISLALS